jgi:hypothetical protein
MSAIGAMFSGREVVPSAIVDIYLACWLRRKYPNMKQGRWTAKSVRHRMITESR